MRRDKRRVKKHFCMVCGVHGETRIHHIFFGRNRRISERNDLVIELCFNCHWLAHNSSMFARSLKKRCEAEYLEHHSQEDWKLLNLGEWLVEQPDRVSGKKGPSDDFDDETGETTPIGVEVEE